MNNMYHFGGKEEAIRIMQLLDSYNNDFRKITDIRQFSPHKVILFEQVPITPATWGATTRFGILSEDGRSVSYCGVFYKYGLNKEGIGFLGREIKNNKKFEDLKLKETKIDYIYRTWD